MSFGSSQGWGLCKGSPLALISNDYTRDSLILVQLSSDLMYKRSLPPCSLIIRGLNTTFKPNKAAEPRPSRYRADAN